MVPDEDETLAGVATARRDCTTLRVYNSMETSIDAIVYVET